MAQTDDEIETLAAVLLELDDMAEAIERARAAIEKLRAA